VPRSIARQLIRCRVDFLAGKGETKLAYKLAGRLS